MIELKRKEGTIFCELITIQENQNAKVNNINYNINKLTLFLKIILKFNYIE
jgi:hypothetical protein